MPVARNPDLQRAVADAVRLVNAHSGQASVRLQFRSTESADVDLIANAASLSGELFSFTSGFDTVRGSVAELANIQADLIGHQPAVV